jgi:hypothetical protein
MPEKTPPAATLTPGLEPEMLAQWSRADLPDPAPGVFGGGTPSDVIWFRDRYIAVGTIATECCADGDPSANVGVVWTSRDGRSWRIRQTTGIAEHAMLGAHTTSGLATNGSVLVTVGMHAEPSPEGTAERLAAAWATADGINWTRARDPVPSLIAARGESFVGVAITLDDGSPKARFMTSDDGLAWSYSSAWIEASVSAIAVGAGGRVVAVGSTHVETADGGQSNAVVFQSDDGAHWVGPTTVFERASPKNVTASGDGFLVTGWWIDRPIGPGQPDHDGIWRTANGLDWQPLPLVVGDEEYLDEVFVTGKAIVVVGETHVEAMANAMIWISADGGVTWGRVARDPAFSGVNNQIEGLVPTAEGLLAIGRRWDTRSGHPMPVAWFASG